MNCQTCLNTLCHCQVFIKVFCWIVLASPYAIIDTACCFEAMYAVWPSMCCVLLKDGQRFRSCEDPGVEGVEKWIFSLLEDSTSALDVNCVLRMTLSSNGIPTYSNCGSSQATSWKVLRQSKHSFSGSTIGNCFMAHLSVKSLVLGNCVGCHRVAHGVVSR